MQMALKSSSISSYMFKTYHLIIQGFDNNRTAQEKILKHICYLGHRKSGGRGEDFLFLPLMLRPPKINSTSSILRLSTVLQVI